VESQVGYTEPGPDLNCSITYGVTGARSLACVGSWFVHLENEMIRLDW
jgi:hypothetical protein